MPKGILPPLGISPVVGKPLGYKPINVRQGQHFFRWTPNSHRRQRDIRIRWFLISIGFSGRSRHIVIILWHTQINTPSQNTALAQLTTFDRKQRRERTELAFSPHWLSSYNGLVDSRLTTPRAASCRRCQLHYWPSTNRLTF